MTELVQFDISIKPQNSRLTKSRGKQGSEPNVNFQQRHPNQKAKNPKSKRKQNLGTKIQNHRENYWSTGKKNWNIGTHKVTQQIANSESNTDLNTQGSAG